MASRRTAAFVILALSSAASVLAGACSTDNGDNSHGPTIGKLPDRDANVKDGTVILPDGRVIEPGEDSGDEGSVPCASGIVAVLAGNDTTLNGAIQDKGGAWVTTTIPNGAALSKPAVAAFGNGFVGVTRGSGNTLQSTTFGSSWTAASTFGGAGVKGAPTLAIAGTKAHVVYSAGPDESRNYLHGIHDGANWNAATATVGEPPNQSFGTVSAGLAAAGTDLVFAENGADNPGVGGGLYVRTFGASWANAAAVNGVGTVGNLLPATPEIVPVEGAFDLLLVYVEKTTRRVSFATRNAQSKAWVDGDNIHADATTAEKLSLARVGQSTVLVAFRGQDTPDGKGYYAQGTIGPASVSWTTPNAIGPGAAFVVDSTPAVARGVCGDDAIVAYASQGVVKVTRLRGTVWTTPETIPSVTGTYVAIATR